eukprot:15485132-Heterocapsa_arctica.AAC.1
MGRSSEVSEASGARNGLSQNGYGNIDIDIHTFCAGRVRKYAFCVAMSGRARKGGTYNERGNLAL